jgi:hypothetical protein
MARVRLFGTEFNADPIEEREGGWLMRSRAHTHRTAVGTVFFAATHEIVEMAAAEKPASAGAADIEAAMAQEREMLPTFADIDATNGNAKAREGRMAAYKKAIAQFLVG